MTTSSLTSSPFSSSMFDDASPNKEAIGKPDSLAVRQSQIMQFTESAVATGTEAAADLKQQGEMLQSTDRNLDQMQAQIHQTQADLQQMQNAGRCRSCGCFQCFLHPLRLLSDCMLQKLCCRCMSIRKRPEPPTSPPKVIALDERKVDTEWCRRYDPDERWLRQLESELDRLIAMADEMHKACDQQIELTQSMAQKAANVRQDVTSARKQMHQIIEPNTVMNNT